MCNWSDQDEMDRLYGYAMRLAKKVAFDFGCIDLLESANSIPAREQVVKDMEARVSHKRLVDEEIANWYARKDKAGIPTGD